MKKSELKTGMVVEYDDGRRRVVLLGTNDGDILVNIENGELYDLKKYEENLRTHYKNININKVYQPRNTICYLKSRDDSYMTLLWEREEETVPVCAGDRQYMIPKSKLKLVQDNLLDLER